jgi:hypothetical protein
MPQTLGSIPFAGEAAAAKRTDARGFREEAFFFGPEGAPLYAVLHLPARGDRAASPERPDGTPAFPPIVHVHSYGIEQVASYRIEVEMARAAAAAGFPVLRFHMTGAGDSGGDFAEITIDGMVRDVERAVQLVSERGLVPAAPRERGTGVALLGVRLGCDVAIRAAAALGGVRALILWEPAPEPRAYLESILRSRIISALAQGEKRRETVASLVETLRRDGAVDILGYPVHRRIYEEATPLTIEPLAAQSPSGHAAHGLAEHALVVSIGNRQKPGARAAEIAARLLGAGVRADLRELREEAAWQFNSNPSFVSPALTEMTLSWCIERLAGGEGLEAGSGGRSDTGRGAGSAGR